MTESPTNSIQNHTHSIVAFKKFEKIDVSCFHVATTEEDILTSIVEELSYQPTKSSTDPIRNQTHFVVALKFFEKIDVSCFHIATPDEEIQTSTVEELSTNSLTLIGSNSKIQDLSIMIVIDLISFYEKNQAPQGSFEIVVGDSMSVYSYEWLILHFLISWIFLEATSYFGGQSFALHGPRSFVSSCSITYSSPHSARNDGDLLHLLGCMLLSSGVESNSHGSKYQAHQDSFEPDFKIKLNEHCLLLFC